MKTITLQTSFGFLLTSLAALSGCGSPAHDLGDSPEARNANLEQDPPAQQPVADFISEFDGVWVGEAENPFSRDLNAPPYQFPSGSTRIRLELGSADPAANNITFGAGPELAPPSDPTVIYPAGAESYVRVGYMLEPWEGYPYPTYPSGVRLDDLHVLAPESYATLEEIEILQRLEAEGRVIDGKLALQYRTHDLFRDWFELQPLESGCNPQTFDASRLGSTEDEAGNCVDVAGVPVDCGRALLCSSIGPVLSDPPVSELTLQLTTDGLIGVLSSESYFRNERGFLSSIGPIHFRRAAVGE